jgi:hypothetical protein
VKLILTSLCTVVLASACATTGLNQADRLALYRANAGDPVGSIRKWNNNVQWRVLSDDALVVWVRPNEAHLFEFRTRCIGLRSARTITISNFGGLVSSRFDTVTITAPVSATSSRTGCRISSIRPLDMRAINDTKRDMREAQTVERDPNTVIEPLE